jgi:hypothetical protein
MTTETSTDRGGEMIARASADKIVHRRSFDPTAVPLGPAQRGLRRAG